MRRTCMTALILWFGVVFCFGQNAAPAATGHGAFPVKLIKTLESSKLKEGDTIEAETSGSFKLANGTLVPKGSKLMGHVTAAKSRSKGDPDSELSIAFDKLNVADGKELAVKGTVQAVFPPAEENNQGANAMVTTAAGGSTKGGPIAGTNATVTSSTPGANMDSGNSVQAVANPNSVGVHEIHDLQLENGVLTSKGKQVKLSNGVRMIVHVDIFS